MKFHQKQKTMKKALLTAGLILVAGAAFAQKGVTSIGARLGYGADFEKFSIGAQVRHGFTNELRGAASFDYYFTDKGITVWDINADLHYLFPLDSKFTVYPLVGLSYLHAKVDLGNNGSASDGKLGLNLGGGIDYNFASNLALTGELKYQFVSGHGQLVPSIGIAYKF